MINPQHGILHFSLLTLWLIWQHANFSEVARRAALHLYSTSANPHTFLLSESARCGSTVSYRLASSSHFKFRTDMHFPVPLSAFQHCNYY
jgi:hypothetical protein